MRFRALGLALLTLAALTLSTCGAGSGASRARPRVGVGLTALAGHAHGAKLHVTPGSSDAGLSDSYQATLSWNLPAFPATTGYYTFQDGQQVGSPTSSPYVFLGLACATTFTFGVQAHNGSGGTGPTYSTSYTTPACSGGGGGTVNCPLTHAGGADPNTSCWATHTGVLNGTGCTEAQIEAQGSGPCGPVGNGTGGTFTVMTGDPTFHSIVINTSNTTIDHVWAQGACFEIHDSIQNVTIENTLVTGGNTNCGGDSAGGSVINTGQGASIATNTLVKDVTLDGGLPAFGAHTAAITLDGGEALRVNVFGFAQGFISDSNTAAAPALFQDDYGHDYRGCSHDDGTWFDSSSYVTFEHGWIWTNDATQQGPDGCATAALAGGSDFGPQDHVTYDSSYADGGDGEGIHTGCGSTQMTITNNAVDSATAKDASAGGYQSLTGNTWTGNYSVETTTGANLGSWGPFATVC